MRCSRCGLAITPGEVASGVCSPCARGLAPSRAEKGETVGKDTCKIAGCGKKVSTAKPSLGLCFRHLREHPEAPPSVRAMGAPKRKPGRRAKAPARRPARASTPPCPMCRQPMPEAVCVAVGILQEYGLKDAEDRMKAAIAILGACR